MCRRPREILEAIAIVTAGGGVVIAALAHLLAQRGHFHTVMISCIDRYQQLLPALNRSSSRVGSALQESDRDAIRAYLDLSNEELFYFKARYLPRAVAIEWTEGILAVLESKKDAWSTEIAGYPRLAALLEAASESNEADSGRLAKAALLAN